MDKQKTDRVGCFSPPHQIGLRINSHVSRAHGDLLAKNSLRRYFGKKRERGTGLYLDKLMVFERKNVLLRYHGPVS